MGETLEKAIDREVWEETQYRVTGLKVAYTSEFITPYNHDQAVIYEVEIDSSSQICDSKINDPDQIVNEKKWIHVSELTNYLETKYLSPLQNWLNHAALENKL